jgi:hypothetical protein
MYADRGIDLQAFWEGSYSGEGGVLHQSSIRHRATPAWQPSSHFREKRGGEFLLAKSCPESDKDWTRIQLQNIIVQPDSEITCILGV